MNKVVDMESTACAGMWCIHVMAEVTNWKRLDTASIKTSHAWLHNDPASNRRSNAVVELKMFYKETGKEIAEGSENNII